MDDHIYRDDFADNAGHSAASTIDLPLTSPPAARARVSDQGSAPAERPALVPAGRALFAVPRRPPEQGGQGAGGGGIGTQGSPPESRREVDVPPPAGAAESGGGRDPAVARCPGCRGRVSATQPGRGSQCALCGGGWGRGGWAHECSACNAFLCKECAVATSESGGALRVLATLMQRPVRRSWLRPALRRTPARPFKTPAAGPRRAEFWCRQIASATGGCRALGLNCLFWLVIAHLLLVKLAGELRCTSTSAWRPRGSRARELGTTLPCAA